MSPLVLRYLIVAWLCFELGLGIHNLVARRRGQMRDSGSKPLIFLAIFVGFALAYRMRRLGVGDMASPLGWPIYVATGLLLLGFLTRLHAVTALGRFFTTTVTVSSEQQLVQRGLYARIRHPGYLGSFLIFTGLGFAFGNWLSLCFLLGLTIPAFLYRIHIEERAMEAQFGASYAAYRQRTKRLIPGLF